MAVDIQGIIGQLEQMTVLDLVELKKSLEADWERDLRRRGRWQAT